MPKLGLGLGIPKPLISGGGSSPVIPPAGLSLWLKADAGVTLSGSDVTSWADQSGNGNNASSAAGTRPTLVSNTLNSKPILRFNGTGQQMSLTSSIGGTEYTIVIVCKNNDNELGSMFLWTTDENYGLYIGVLTDETFNEDARNKFLLSEADAGGGGEGSVLAWSSASANNNFFIGTATQNGGGKAYLNGAGGTNSLGTFSASNLFNLIGGYGFGYELDGDVAEIIAYNRVLTTPERQQVEQYLNSKYQIYPWRIVISGAGTTSSNDEYVWDGVTTYENKPVYNAISGSQIFWFGGLSSWILYDDTEGLDTYRSIDLTTWTADAGSSPVPSSTFYYTP